MSKRPVPVTVLAVLYIAIGVIGFVHHFPDVRGAGAFAYENIWIELTELLALVCGVFMLRGANWARWLAVAWIAFHVVLSFFDAYRGLVVHIVICAAIAWLLFRPQATRYFRGTEASTF